MNKKWRDKVAAERLARAKEIATMMKKGLLAPVHGNINDTTWVRHPPLKKDEAAMTKLKGESDEGTD